MLVIRLELQDKIQASAAIAVFGFIFLA